MGNSDLQGRILLWHNWTEEETAILNETIDVFERLHPEVTVIAVQVTETQLRTRYEETAALGLGPDLLIGPSNWLLPLANAGVIDDIRLDLLVDTDFDREHYVPSAFALVNYAEGIYGLPLSLRTPVLYYNRTLLGETPPATTFEELLTQAQEGQRVALSTRSEMAFMGIQAFGSPLFDDELRLRAMQDGFVNWLEWLQAAQGVPGVILSADEERLATLFMEGQLTYYVASYNRLQPFQMALNVEGEQVVGAAPLPSGPVGQARPLIRADLLMFNTVSSEEQRTIALELAQFLTNIEQNNTFMREIGRVPANQRVRINAGVYPLIAAFAQQGRTAVALPPSVREIVVSEAGDAVYTAVLSGAADPQSAVCEFIQTVRQQLETGAPDFDSCEAAENGAAP